MESFNLISSPKSQLLSFDRRHPVQVQPGHPLRFSRHCLHVVATSTPQVRGYNSPTTPFFCLNILAPAPLICDHRRWACPHSRGSPESYFPFFLLLPQVLRRYFLGIARFFAPPPVKNVFLPQFLEYFPPVFLDPNCRDVAFFLATRAARHPFLGRGCPTFCCLLLYSPPFYLRIRSWMPSFLRCSSSGSS